MFETLTGVPPFKGESPLKTLMSHISETVPAFKTVAPKLVRSSSLEKIVRRTLEKDPAHRYQSAAELMEDLRLVELGKRPKLPRGPKKAIAINKWIPAAGAALLIAVSYHLYSQSRIPSGRFESMQPTSWAWEGVPRPIENADWDKYDEDSRYFSKLSTLQEVPAVPLLKERAKQLYSEMAKNYHNDPGTSFADSTYGEGGTYDELARIRPSLQDDLQWLQAHRISDKELIATLENILGLCAYRLRDFPEAEKAYKSALADSETPTAEALAGEANCLYFQKRFSDAIPFYERAVQQFKPGNDGKLPLDYGMAQSRLADCYRLTRQYPASRKAYGKACDYWYQLQGDDSQSFAMCWLYLAYLDSVEPPDMSGTVYPQGTEIPHEKMYARGSAFSGDLNGKLAYAENKIRWAFAGQNYLGLLLSDVYSIKYKDITISSLLFEIPDRIGAFVIQHRTDFSGHWPLYGDVVEKSD